MLPNTSTAVYKKRIEDISHDLRRLKKKKNAIGWSRFISVIVFIAGMYLLTPHGILHQALAGIPIIAVFLWLVALSVRNNEMIKNLQLLLQVNKEEISISEGHYAMLPDGKKYQPGIHDYSQDLDIFGRASLYQYINRTTSEQGNETLARWLLHPATAESVAERQEAARELQDQYEWRQQLQAYGLAENITVTTQQRIESWLNETNGFATATHWKWLRYVLPVIILTALLLLLSGMLAASWFTGLLLVFFLISGLISRKVQPVYLKLNKIVQEIETLSNIVLWVEQPSFTSALLQRLQQCYKKKDFKASREVKALKNNLDRFDYRLNPPVFLLLNTFLLWDLQQVLTLEKWKARNKQYVPQWFESIGMLESLSTIAAIGFNHRLWCWPILVKERGLLLAEELGHPLISETKRVCSSFTTTGTAKISLITGSNMAGKSTFLRSMGVSVVLAMMGAPACARRMQLSAMRIISSMRVADNLEESTSTFYAELKKLKAIIEAVNRGEEVYLLLDEILRGTNSLDRHTGSKALIHQLIKHNAVGVLATHDLELAKLVDEYPANIHNYHFDVQVNNEELYFDYRLKNGVCKSMNASILMKKIGIEL